ncbi:MAG: hypothetical protein ACE5ES_01780 [Candidatus Nanoarchaeia archaeon]
MTKPEPLKDKINQFRDNYGNNHDNYFLENDVKVAVEFYLKYENNIEDLRNDYLNLYKTFFGYECEAYKEYDKERYKNWLFKIAFKDVIE